MAAILDQLHYLYKDKVAVCEKHFWRLAGSMTHPSYMSKAFRCQNVSQARSRRVMNICALFFEDRVSGTVEGRDPS